MVYLYEYYFQTAPILDYYGIRKFVENGLCSVAEPEK